MKDQEENKNSGITVSNELIERLVSRLEVVEQKLEEWEKKVNSETVRKTENKKKTNNDKTTAQKVADSLGDRSNEIIKESGRMIGSLIDASAEAIKQTADSLADMDEETDKEKLGEVPAAIVSIFRKMVDIQKKVVDKFEDSYKEYDED